MLSLSDDNHAHIIEAFNSTARYLDGLLSINNLLFLTNSMSGISYDISINPFKLNGISYSYQVD